MDARAILDMTKTLRKWRFFIKISCDEHESLNESHKEDRAKKSAFARICKGIEVF